MNGRDKRRAKAARNAARAPKPVCLNCGTRGLHFVPPSLGEKGFYACPGCPACGQPGNHLIYDALWEPRQFSCGDAPELMLQDLLWLPPDLLAGPLEHKRVDPKLEAQFLEKYMNIDGYNPFRK